MAISLIEFITGAGENTILLISQTRSRRCLESSSILNDLKKLLG